MLSKAAVAAVVLLNLQVTASTARADELLDRVVASFRQQAPEIKVDIKNLNELQIGGVSGLFAVYLDNVRSACVSKPAACEGEVTNFVAGVLDVAKSHAEIGVISPDKVYIVLRQAGFGQNAGKQWAGDAKKQLITRPFVEGLEQIYVLDTPRAYRFVNQGDLDLAGLSLESLHEAALRNVSKLEPLKYDKSPGMPDIFFMPAGDGLGTARIFDAPLWDRIEKDLGSGVVVCVPTRDWILFVKDDNLEAPEKMKMLAGRIVKGEPYAVSSVMFRRKNSSWQVYAQ